MFYWKLCHKLININVLDNKRIENLNYQGFPLKNYGGKNVYSIVTADECQYLCEITNLCQYFNFIISTNSCYLKFGVGKKKSYPNDGAFGHKYSSGDNMTSVLYNTV